MTFIRYNQTCSHIERSCLTCTIWSKQTYDFSLLHIDGNTIGDSSFTITFHQTLSSENQFIATIRLLLIINYFVHNLHF